MLSPSLQLTLDVGHTRHPRFSTRWLEHISIVVKSDGFITSPRYVDKLLMFMKKNANNRTLYLNREYETRAREEEDANGRC